MLYAGAVRVVALGIFIAGLTACGGGGSGGSEGGGAPIHRNNPEIALPDTASATQKLFTPENAKPALVLALNTIDFISGWIPYPIQSSAGQVGKLRLQQKLKNRQAVEPSADASVGMCASGMATASEAGDKVSIEFINCDTGDLILDGALETVTNAPSSQITLSEFDTLQGLRVTAVDQSFDVVLDGTISVTVSNKSIAQQARVPEGRIDATLDIRDLQAGEGYRAENLETTFNIANALGSGELVAEFVGHTGRIYDSEGQYFDLSKDGPGSFLSVILDQVVAQHAREIAATQSAPKVLGLVGDMSSIYLYQNADSNLVSFQLMQMIPVEPAPNAPSVPWSELHDLTPATAFYVMQADITSLSAETINTHIPAISFDGVKTLIVPGEKLTIPYVDVVDEDQQFVNISWQLVQKPAMASPTYFAYFQGFIFSSSTVGDYQFILTASDGVNVAQKALTITVGNG